MHKATRFLALLLFGLGVGLTMLPGSAWAWWNDDWSMRKQITIDTSAAGGNISDPIGATPVLIRLHVGNFKFDAGKDDGSDIRFVADDDKTPLKYHIEQYDGLLGQAFVWVGVPDLKPGAQTHIYIYYGNKKANAADDARGTFDADTVLVYHFGEHGTPARDWSNWGNNAQSAGLSDDGALIGGGLRFDGKTLVTLPGSPSLTTTAGGAMTWSAWINEAALQPNAIIYSRRDGANALLIGVDNGVPFVSVTTAAGTQRSSAGGPIAAASWHHLAVVATAGAPQMTLYLDGNPYGTVNAALPALNTTATLGGDPAAAAAAPSVPPAAPAGPAATTPPAAGSAGAPNADPNAQAQAAAPAAPAAPAAIGFNGEMDELEIAKVARPAGFIKAAAIGEGTASAKFVTYGVDEETASWFSGYFVVILRSVTIDGWVVIGLLAIMAVISWIVMADKAAYVGRVAKANTQFLASFRHLAADLVVLDKGDIDEAPPAALKASANDQKMMRNSSLYRIYHIGAAEIRHRITDEHPKVLAARSIEAIRASLDTGLVRENQRLNRMMVILTIAISGGPFLGLLGTVVGVMITFASIAASGDVNVNAIAPGIAAALVATVAGLVVAIPALFGYNYLVSRTREISSDMQVFVDEFVTKMAEFYRDRDPQKIAAE